MELLNNDNIDELYLDPFPQIFRINRVLNDNRGNNEKNNDEYNCIMQWKDLLEILIIFMKDDSCIYWDLMRNYSDTLSPKTKRYLFSIVKKNKFAMEDLENILKEKLIHEIISNGNIIEMKSISQNIDNYLQTLFEENNKFNELLDELTYNKMNGDRKLLFLKDTYFKNFDINYYISLADKSSAQRYLLEFKKDAIKSYNNYYYNPSKLTFELFEIVYEKILLNKNNLELMIKIIEKLLSKENIIKKIDIKSVRNNLLPVILNYLLMFCVINTKSFIEFKIENKDLIIKLQNILSESLKTNKDNNNNDNENIILEKDLEEYIAEVINQLNKYQIISDSIENDLSKLNKYDYNIDILDKLKEQQLNNNNLNIINFISTDSKKKADEKKEKSKNMKNKMKNLMKKKSDLFLDKVSLNQEMIEIINDQNQNQDNIKDNNEIMCFFCRNSINLNSFDIPYGKLGLLINDYFYINSLKASIRSELSKLTNKDYNKNNIYDKIVEQIDCEKFNRITSCGHYFHMSCFNKGCTRRRNIDIFQFSCPLCLKKQNILIPPLNHFKEKYIFFKSEKIDELFIEKPNIKKNEINNKDYELFEDFIDDLLLNNGFDSDKYNDYNSFIKDIYPIYKGHFNFMENIFYIKGTTFHKYQQIDTLQNFNLSLRFIIKIEDFFIIQIINYIKDNLSYLAKGPNEKEFIYNHNDMHMYHVNLLEKILLSLSILFDYDEMKTSFKYIIYIFLPYFCFGFYYRDLMFKKENNNLNITQFNEKMNINDLQKYLKDNNKQLLNYLNIFLKKFCLIKLLTDFNNKNEDIINSFNELSIDNLLSLLDMGNLYELLPKNENNEINFIDIINILPKIFNPNEVFYIQFENNLDHNKVFDLIFNNIKKNNNENALIVKELIIQFSPIKFEFIHLDNNIFDCIEKNLEKKCDICNQLTRYSFICLICGNKVCHEKYSFYHTKNHVKKCGGMYCLFLDIDNMKIYLWTINEVSKKLFSIYVNEAGNGPKGYEIGNEYNLSNEKLSNAIKNYICYDFN